MPGFRLGLGANPASQEIVVKLGGISNGGKAAGMTPAEVVEKENGLPSALGLEYKGITTVRMGGDALGRRRRGDVCERAVCLK